VRPRAQVREFRHLCETLANMSAARDVLRETQLRYSGRLAFSLQHVRFEIVELWMIAGYIIAC
jgi:hypothetical protein